MKVPYTWCDRHGHKLAGANPVIAPERREYVGKGKGARRNFPDLPEEGTTGDGKPMRDLKEAGAKIATQARCEPLVGLTERARYP